MKSGKQRKQEIKAARLARIEKRKGLAKPLSNKIPPGAVAVNSVEVRHHSMLLNIPRYYQDKHFECRECGTPEIWTAQQQQWWYEVIKGDLETTAVYCKTCRQRYKAEKEARIKQMQENIAHKPKPHPNQAFLYKLERNK